jgi:hypothetical protein
MSFVHQKFAALIATEANRHAQKFLDNTPDLKLRPIGPITGRGKKRTSMV